MAQQWNPINHQPEPTLQENEVVWLAFENGVVTLGKYADPPFRYDSDVKPSYFGTMYGQSWVTHLPTHWQPLDKPAHPSR